MHRVTPWPEHVRLRAESERIRAEAIRVRIASVQAFCSVVVSEARWISPQKAQESLGKVWRKIAVLKQHLAEPQHVPGEAAGELLRALASLEERALQLQESLSRPWSGFTAVTKRPGAVRVTAAGRRGPQTSQ